MPKLKTKKAAAKRYRLTGTGKIKRNKSKHILGKKSTKRKRNLRKATTADKTVVKTIKKKLMPYA